MPDGDQEKDKNQESDQPSSDKEASKDGGFGSSGGYSDKKPQPETDQPVADESDQPQVDSFSPPGSETSKEEPLGEEAGGELRMPSEKEIEKGPVEPEKEEPASKAEEEPETPAEDIFGEKEEPRPEADQPLAEEKEEKEEEPLKVPEEEAGPEKEKKEEEPEKEAEQKISIPEEKEKGGGRKACCVVFVILFIIILILAGLVFVNEWGILNLGIEKYYGKIKLETLWGGLPIDGKIAAAKSWQKMQGENYEVSGDLKIKVAKAELETTSNLRGEVESQTKYSLGLSYNLESIEPFLKILNIDLDLSEVDVDYKRDGEDIYLKNKQTNTLLGNKRDWYKIKFEGESTKTIEKTDIKDFSDNVVGERTSWAEVSGVACYVYEYKVDLKEIFKNSIKLKEANAKLYLGKRDKLVRKLVLNYEDQSGLYSYEIESFLDFDAYDTEVRVSLPGGEEYTEISYQGLYENVITKSLTGEFDSTKFKDSTRKSDISRIKEALGEYKEAEGSYLDTKGQVVKTSDKDSALEDALVPSYLDSLPVDPNDPDFWYGYKSNGKTYELWSVLENKDDPDGEDYQGYWIYKIRG